MSAVFNTITGDDWRRSLAEARGRKNEVARQIHEKLALLDGDGFGDDDEIAPARQKSKRTRIKDHRANRHRRRFYVVIDGVERSRDTGVRQPFTILRLPKIKLSHEPL